MKFLQELVRFSRLGGEDDEDDNLISDKFNGDLFGDKEPLNTNLPQDDEGPLEVEPSPNDETFGDEEQVETEEPEDPNKQGMIRTVKGAHLVYKREVEDGTYEELWMYNATNLRDEIIIRKAILAGTDIPVNRSESPDGSQSFELWAAGNAELLLIKGLTQ